MNDLQATQSNRYTLIPRTLIFLTRGGRVLLLKGAPGKRLWAGLYNGLGGHIERGEDFLSAARRELAEESGIESAGLWLCGVVTVDTGTDGTRAKPGIGIFVLRGEARAEELHASREGSLEWVPFEQVRDLPTVEDLPLLLPRVLAMEPGEPPFSAQSTYDEQGRLQIRFTD